MRLTFLISHFCSFFCENATFKNKTNKIITENKMAEDGNDVENELLDYEEDETETTTTAKDSKKDIKGSYVGIHSSGFRDFLLKPELLRAIVDCGFEHPSEGM